MRTGLILGIHSSRVKSELLSYASNLISTEKTESLTRPATNLTWQSVPCFLISLATYSALTAERWQVLPPSLAKANFSSFSLSSGNWKKTPTHTSYENPADYIPKGDGLNKTEWVGNKDHAMLLLTGEKFLRDTRGKSLLPFAISILFVHNHWFKLVDLQRQMKIANSQVFTSKPLTFQQK